MLTPLGYYTLGLRLACANVRVVRLAGSWGSLLDVRFCVKGSSGKSILPGGLNS